MLCAELDDAAEEDGFAALPLGVADEAALDEFAFAPDETEAELALLAADELLLSLPPFEQETRAAAVTKAAANAEIRLKLKKITS